MVKAAGVNDVIEQLRDENETKSKEEERLVVVIRAYMVLSILWTIFLTILALSLHSDAGNVYKTMLAGLMWVSKTINFSIISIVPKRRIEFLKNWLQSETPTVSVKRRRRWMGFFLLYKVLVTTVLFIVCIMGIVKGESNGLLIFILVTYILFYLILSLLIVVLYILNKRRQSNENS